MNFTEKTLVVSGCSFTSGGGLDNPNYWDFLFPDINKKDYLLDDYPNQSFYNEIVDKNNYVYFLSEVARFREYYNLSAGGAGIFSTMQRLYRFIKENPHKDMFIIYQPPAYNRIETIVNGYFSSLWNLNYNSKLFNLFYENFYDDVFYFYKSILEIDNFIEFCKSKKINYMILDWSNIYNKNSEFFMEQIKKYYEGRETTYSDYHGWFTNQYEMNYYDFYKIISSWELLNVNWFTSQTDYLISKDGILLDSHLSPYGAKKLAEFIFENIKPKLI